MYLQKEYWQGPEGVKNVMEGTAGMEQVGRWGTPVPPSSEETYGDAATHHAGDKWKQLDPNEIKANPAPTQLHLESLDEEQEVRGTEDESKVLALPPAPTSPATASPASRSPPNRWAGYATAV